MDEITTAFSFRRELSRDETSRWRKLIEERYGRWYGGYCAAAPGEVLRFRASGVPGWEETLRSCLPGNGRCFEIREFDSSWEVDKALVDLGYVGAEGYIVPPDLSWMVNASHEDIIVLAGGELIARLQAVCPEVLLHRPS